MNINKHSYKKSLKRVLFSEIIPWIELIHNKHIKIGDFGTIE